jgi:hypothetical protein
VPIKAPRPLPKPERAMRLRLPEQGSERKRQSVGPVPESLLAPSLRRSSSDLAPEKHFKKNIDNRNQNRVSRRKVPKETKTFAR